MEVYRSWVQKFWEKVKSEKLSFVDGAGIAVFSKQVENEKQPKWMQNQSYFLTLFLFWNRVSSSIAFLTQKLKAFVCLYNDKLSLIEAPENVTTYQNDD